MAAELIALAGELAQSFKDDEETASGEILESKLEVKLGEFEEGTGITLKSELLLDGPELTKE